MQWKARWPPEEGPAHCPLPTLRQEWGAEQGPAPGEGVLEPPLGDPAHRKTLQLSRQLKDQAVEAQACYSLGNTYTLLQDYERAAEYHLRHLLIAQELADRCVPTGWGWGDAARGAPAGLLCAPPPRPPRDPGQATCSDSGTSRSEGRTLITAHRSFKLPPPTLRQTEGP